MDRDVTVEDLKRSLKVVGWTNIVCGIACTVAVLFTDAPKILLLGTLLGLGMGYVFLKAKIVVKEK